MAVEANWETQNKMSQSRHAISKSGSTPLGLFVKLPQEIRDMIYEPVLSAGHTSITRASKALSQDTKVALSQYGIFRVCIAHDDRNVITRFALHPQLQGARLHDIRNLDLSYKPARFGATFPSADWIEGTLADLLHDLKFVIGDPGRCNFRLDMQGYEFSDREETAAFPLLRGFKHVRVEVCVLRFPRYYVLSEVSIVSYRSYHLRWVSF